MTSSKSTKRALISSTLAILMCVAMLIGTTFAWFTDTASTAVNKIQAGNLEIELQMKDNNGNWVNAEGKTLPFLVEGKIPAEGTQILWEPGCTYYVPQIRVLNKGNLAVKIEYLPEALGVTGKLAEVLEPVFKTPVDANGEEVNIEPEILKPGEASPAWSFGYRMDKNAGNEYQNATASGMYLTVVATQATYEKDSKDDQYDKDAQYPDVVVVTDETALKEALLAGKDVRLGSNIALTSAVTFNGDVEVVGDGNSIISSKEVYVAPTANVSFKNVNFATPDNANDNASSVYASRLEGKVVFDGCTFTNPQWECIQITPMDGAEVVVTNCTFVVDGTGTYAHNTKVERMLHIQNTAASGKYTAVITNNKFIGVDLCRNAVIDVDDIEAFANVTCGGNTFYNHDNTPVSTMADGMIYVNINGLYDAANVATNTYAQFTQTPAAALHH